jgi:hypothetical protein
VIRFDYPKWYDGYMATFDKSIQLTDQQLRLLSEWSARTGKSPQELLAEALREYDPGSESSPANGHQSESLTQRLARKGLLGCLSGGPPDLSTNPIHMEGFGE